MIGLKAKILIDRLVQAVSHREQAQNRQYQILRRNLYVKPYKKISRELKLTVPGVPAPEQAVSVNHHRQLHYGKVELAEVNSQYFVFRIDQDIVRVGKITGNSPEK